MENQFRILIHSEGSSRWSLDYIILLLLLLLYIVYREDRSILKGFHLSQYSFSMSSAPCQCPFDLRSSLCVDRKSSKHFSSSTLRPPPFFFLHFFDVLILYVGITKLVTNKDRPHTGILDVTIHLTESSLYSVTCIEDRNLSIINPQEPIYSSCAKLCRFDFTPKSK